MSLSSIGMKDLLEAGVHFGHKSSHWNPKMKKYIFMKRKGVHIIDLQKTLNLVENAFNYVKNVVANGGEVLFVGTKKQARQAVIEEASQAGVNYIGTRWIGGLLTNFKTVKHSIKKLNEINELLEDTEKQEMYTKKEIFSMQKVRDKMEATLGGIKTMRKLPDLIFVIDSNHEKIAIQEAKKMNIPVVALVDTNADPSDVDVIIPGNDDAIRAISLFVGYISGAVIDGRNLREGLSAEEAAKAEAEEKAAADGEAETAEVAAEASTENKEEA